MEYLSKQAGFKYAFAVRVMTPSSITNSNVQNVDREKNKVIASIAFDTPGKLHAIVQAPEYEPYRRKIQPFLAGPPEATAGNLLYYYFCSA